MSEGEPRPVGPTSEAPFARVQRVAFFTSGIAEYHKLDRLTYEALTKYAIANLRIREVESDFETTLYSGVGYPVYHDPREGKKYFLIVGRDVYPDFVGTLSRVSSELRNKYLRKTPGARAAVREVQILLNTEFPPKA